MLPLLLTLLLRVLWLYIFPVDPIEPVDSEGFQLLAVNLLAGRGFAWGWKAPFCIAALRTPGYPAVLAGWYALVGVYAERAVYLHLLLEVITTALVMHLARQLAAMRVISPSPCPSPARGEGRRSHTQRKSIVVVFLLGVLYALNGLTPRYVGVLYAEILFVPVFLAALSATLHLLNHPRRRNAALSGVLWAAAILVKPNVQYLAFLITGIVIVKILLKSNKNKWKINLKIALIFISNLIIALSLWIARNGLMLDTWRTSTAFEENMVRVTVPTILAELDGQAIEPWTDTWEYYYDSFLSSVLDEQAWIFRAGPAGVCVERATLAPRVTQAAGELLRENRWLYLKVHVRGVLRGLRDPGHRYWYTLLSGEDWTHTGVVADMGQRVWWSLRQWAVWDAIEAFWSQRVRDIPLDAALVWWGLVLVRTLVHGLALWGLWNLHHKPWAMVLLAISVGYMWLLPGPIAYERFFLPAMPIVLALAVYAVGYKRIK